MSILEVRGKTRAKASATRTLDSSAAFDAGLGWRKGANLAKGDRRVVLQEITARLAGRIDTGVTSFGLPSDFANAMQRVAAIHGGHEKRTGKADPNWPDWYAEYVATEQAGRPLPR